MKEHPLIFRGEMVRAILHGQKTQTRRIINPQPPENVDIYQGSSGTWRWEDINSGTGEGIGGEQRLRYVPGDRVWVRETFLSVGSLRCPNPRIVYRATNNGPDAWLSPSWMPSIHMPRWASRITLEITDVRIQRVQDISDEDALHEGFNHKLADNSLIHSGGHPSYSRENFRIYWNSLYGKDAWDANPWIAALTFQRLNP